MSRLSDEAYDAIAILEARAAVDEWRKTFVRVQRENFRATRRGRVGRPRKMQWQAVDRQRVDIRFFGA